MSYNIMMVFKLWTNFRHVKNSNQPLPNLHQFNIQWTSFHHKLKTIDTFSLKCHQMKPQIFICKLIIYKYWKNRS